MRMFLLLAFVFLPTLTAADTVSDLHIQGDSVFRGTNLTVVQVAGMNLFARATWGQAFVRVTILMASSTPVTKAHGENAGTRDIREGDILDVDGKLVSGADTVMINATRIRDFSLQQTERTLAGTISSADRTALSFLLGVKNPAKGAKATTTLQLSASTSITKGKRAIDLLDVQAGDRVSKVEGIYDYRTNTLVVSRLDMYQDPKVFQPQTYTGFLSEPSGTTLPVSFKLLSGTTTRTVYLPAGASVLNTAKKNTSFSRFAPGDAVRIYGRIRETNLNEIDAEVVRDMEF